MKEKIILDIETTGLHYKNGDEITEIGAIIVDHNFNIIEKNRFII